MAITTVKNRAKSGRAELGAEGRAGQGKERLAIGWMMMMMMMMAQKEQER